MLKDKWQMIRQHLFLTWTLVNILDQPIIVAAEYQTLVCPKVQGVEQNMNQINGA